MLRWSAQSALQERPARAAWLASAMGCNERLMHLCGRRCRSGAGAGGLGALNCQLLVSVDDGCCGAGTPNCQPLFWNGSALAGGGGSGRSGALVRLHLVVYDTMVPMSMTITPG